VKQATALAHILQPLHFSTSVPTFLTHCHTTYVIAGEDDVTSGASSDLKQATALARAMVTKYGMSDKVGQVSLDYEDDGRSMSSETRSLVEDEVRKLVQVRTSA
jgi:ATP-dependent Zn protease